MTKIKLTTYVKDVVKEYGIPDTRTRNIRTMFVKQLQKANLWDNADQANDITKTKIFALHNIVPGLVVALTAFVIFSLIGKKSDEKTNTRYDDFIIKESKRDDTIRTG